MVLPIAEVDAIHISSGSVAIEGDGGTTLNADIAIQLVASGPLDSNFVSLSFSTIAGNVSIHGEPSRDELYMFFNSIFGDVKINLNPHSSPSSETEVDRIYVEESLIHGNLTIDGSNATTDIALITSHVSGNTSIKTGHGSDTIRIADSSVARERKGVAHTFGGNLTIATQKGDDLLLGLSLDEDILIAGDFTFIGGQGEDDVSDFLDAAAVDGAIKLISTEIT